MKLINKLAVSALFALSSASIAAAATVNVIHVTGSTAYRTSDVTAETAWLHSLGSGNIYAEFWDTTAGKTIVHANQSVIYGPVVGGVQYIFENSFNGSVGGVEALVSPSTVVFPSQSVYAATAAAGTPVTVGSKSAAASGGVNGGTTIPSGANADTVTPDIAFSDVFYGTTCSAIISQSTVPATKGTPNENIVGIVPFVFVNGAGSPGTMSNITPQLFSYIESNGGCPLSFFSGLNADEGTTVVALGRDVDSGTRATALLETGYGVNTNVAQYFPYSSTTAASTNSPTAGVVGIDTNASTVAALAPVPVETLDGYSMGEGDGGYYSGGNLATAMAAPNTTMANSTASPKVPTWLVTYLGVSDAQSAIGSGKATLMSYNGFKFDPTSINSPTNEALIQEGQYTFWGYEHEFYYGSTTAPVGTAAGGLSTYLVGATNAIDTLASDGITLSAMNVQRSDDGANVQVGNPY